MGALPVVRLNTGSTLGYQDNREQNVLWLIYFILKVCTSLLSDMWVDTKYFQEVGMSCGVMCITHNLNSILIILLEVVYVAFMRLIDLTDFTLCLKSLCTNN